MTSRRVTSRLAALTAALAVVGLTVGGAESAVAGSAVSSSSSARSAAAGPSVTQSTSATRSAAHRARGDIRLFARIPAPGEPALSLVTPTRHVFVGTFETIAGGSTAPSKVFEYSSTGRHQRTFTVRGQTPGDAHGVQVAERDRSGRLYLLDQAPARVLVLNPRTGRQRTWATFADVPTCTAAQRQTQCSNTAADNAPEPDYAAWLPDGSLLVTDYAQQLVWRVPPHGGRARVWLNDKRLDGEQFGPAGIVLARGHRSLLLDVGAGGLTTSGATDNQSEGKLYRIRLGHHDKPRRMTELWSSRPGDGPDGFAVARSGHIYVALAGPSGNAVDELARTAGTWRTVWTVPGTPAGAGTSPVPWDTPTSVQFLGSAILVTNEATFTGISSHWVVFDVEAHETGIRPYVPRRAGRR